MSDDTDRLKTLQELGFSSNVKISTTTKQPKTSTRSSILRYTPNKQKLLLWFLTTQDAERYVKYFSPNPEKVAILTGYGYTTKSNWQTIIVHIGSIDAESMARSQKYIKGYLQRSVSEIRNLHFV